MSYEKVNSDQELVCYRPWGLKKFVDQNTDITHNTLIGIGVAIFVLLIIQGL